VGGLGPLGQIPQQRLGVHAGKHPSGQRRGPGRRPR
jgi:hypothetical protein